jgi:uncharacterized protein
VTWTITRQDLLDLAYGAALLGSGGGGDPYIGRLMAQRALDRGRTVTVWDLDEVPDDGLVISTAMMGAPTVMVEKLPSGTEGVAALHALEEHLGRAAVATIPMECGGLNSTLPLVVAAEAGIPVLDADGMGRAFPELQMETFHVFGVSGSPMAIANEHGDVAMVMARNNWAMEWLARGICVRMGGAAMIAEYSMPGALAKRVSIAGTLSLGVSLGAAVRRARRRHGDPLDGLADALAAASYRGPRLLFEGKVEDVFRQTTEGFVKGHARIRAYRSADVMRITFQNEHLIAEVDDATLAVVPDLICVLAAETAEPITTESLRYGQRVTVVSITPPEIMRTPEALDVFGPGAFGLRVSYTPSCLV